MAAHAAVSTGGIQFHFGNQHAFTREALRCWGRELSRALNEAAAGALGLGRTWRLCEAWVTVPDAVTVGIEASSLRSRTGDHDPVRATLLLMMNEWIDETVRSLRQARLRNELKDGVDLEAAGLDLHRLLWSHSWSQAVSGAEASAEASSRGVAAAVGARGRAGHPPAAAALGDLRAAAAPAARPNRAVERLVVDLRARAG